MGLPFGGLVRVRVQTKRGFNVGKAVLAAPEMHFVVSGITVGPRIVSVVRDSHLGFGERRPPLLLAANNRAFPQWTQVLSGWIAIAALVNSSA